MVPEIDRDDGGLVILMHNQRQPVRQDILFERDVDFDILNWLRCVG